MTGLINPLALADPKSTQIGEEERKTDRERKKEREKQIKRERESVRKKERME